MHDLMVLALFASFLSLLLPLLLLFLCVIVYLYYLLVKNSFSLPLLLFFQKPVYF